MTVATPEVNALVEVRGRRWVVSYRDAAQREPSARTEQPAEGGIASTVVTLQSVEDGRYGETLDVVWEVEPGRRVLPVGSLPDLEDDRFDPPQRLAAFLDAVRWSAVTRSEERRVGK